MSRACALNQQSVVGMTMDKGWWWDEWIVGRRYRSRMWLQRRPFSWRPLRVYVVLKCEGQCMLPMTYRQDGTFECSVCACGDVFTGKRKTEKAGIRIKSGIYEYLCNQYQLRSLVMVSLVDVYSSHPNLSRDVSRGPRRGGCFIQLTQCPFHCQAKKATYG